MLRFPIAGVTLLIALIKDGIDDEGIREWMVVEERGLASRADVGRQGMVQGFGKEVVVPLIVAGEAVTNEDGVGCLQSYVYRGQSLKLMSPW